MSGSRPSGLSNPGARLALSQALRATELFRNYRKHLHRLTGFEVFLTDPDNPGAPPARLVNESCRRLCRSEAAGKACVRFHRRLLRDALKGPRTSRCFAGFTCAAIPVWAEGRPVALLEFGPAALHRLNPRPSERVAPRARRDCMSRPGRRLPNAGPAIGVVSPARHRAIVGLLQTFSRQLGDFAAHIVLHTGGGEPDPVARARKFIEEHSEEEIRLAEVARYAHVSAGYLSELFHRTTHESFVHY